MAKNNTSKSSLKNALLEKVRPYIPKEIVMTPKAYREPCSQEKTIDNYVPIVFRDFIANNPSYTHQSLEIIRDDVEYILSKRILVGSSNPNENYNNR